MNKEKQIEEMARAIYETNNSYDTYWESHCKSLATELYDAGCRRQEWISVEDRLPEAETPILIFTRKNRYYVGYYYKASIDTKFTGFYADSCKREATHWMSLPEPPKMKGE